MVNFFINFTKAISYGNVKHCISRGHHISDQKFHTFCPLHAGNVSVYVFAREWENWKRTTQTNILHIILACTTSDICPNSCLSSCLTASLVDFIPIRSDTKQTSQKIFLQTLAINWLLQIYITNKELPRYWPWSNIPVFGTPPRCTALFRPVKVHQKVRNFATK